MRLKDIEEWISGPEHKIGEMDSSVKENVKTEKN